MNINSFCLDQFRRARQAFEIAELSYYNGWPRGGLPMLRAAARLGLQALAGYFLKQPTKGLSLQDLVTLTEPFTSIGYDAFQNFPAEKLCLLDTFDAVEIARRKGDYYQLTEKDIGQLIVSVRTLLENLSTLFAIT